MVSSTVTNPVKRFVSLRYVPCRSADNRGRCYEWDRILGKVRFPLPKIEIVFYHPTSSFSITQNRTFVSGRALEGGVGLDKSTSHLVRNTSFRLCKVTIVIIVFFLPVRTMDVLSSTYHATWSKQGTFRLPSLRLPLHEIPAFYSSTPPARRYFRSPVPPVAFPTPCDTAPPSMTLPICEKEEIRFARDTQHSSRERAW